MAIHLYPRQNVTSRRDHAPSGAFSYRQNEVASVGLAPTVPPYMRCLDGLPVGVDPSGECGKWLVERPTESSQLIERGGLDAAEIEPANNEAVTFSTAQRIGEDFVRDAVEGVIELLIAASRSGKLAQYGQGPTPGKQMDEWCGVGGPMRHLSPGSSCRPFDEIDSWSSFLRSSGAESPAR